MPRRKKRQEEHVNHERWLISYADFITLLFAFFVVMYALSSINEGKYKVMAESLNEAFKNNTQETSIGSSSSSNQFSKDLAASINNHARNNTINNPEDENIFSQDLPLKLLSKRVKQIFKGLIDDGRVNVREDKDWLEIEINSSLLFLTGGSNLTQEAELMIMSLSKMLSKIENPVTVEGYTDNQVISSSIYRSNWELASSRAVTVTNVLVSGGVDYERLAAVSYGENFPVKPNDTVEGRNANRRVVLLVEKEDSRRRHLSSLNKVAVNSFSNNKR